MQGALDIDATGTVTVNADITAGSIALDGANNVALASGAITLDTSAANGVVDLTGGAVDGGQNLTITAGSGAVSLDGVGQTTAIGVLDIDTTGVWKAFNDAVTAGSIALDGLDGCRLGHRSNHFGYKSLPERCGNLCNRR